MTSSEYFLQYIQNVMHDYLHDVKSNAMVILNPDMACGRGNIVVSDDVHQLHTVESINIGVSELTTNDDCDIFVLFKTLKTIYHELRHVWQEQLLAIDTSQIAYEFGLAYVCRLANERYYKNIWNYYHNIRELDAERYAIKASYESLCNDFDFDNLISSTLLQFIKSKQMNKKIKPDTDYYISLTEKYISVKSIFDAFDFAYSDYKNVPRWCSCFDGMSIYDGLSSCEPGLAQDEFIARAFLNSDSENREIILYNTPSLFNFV